MRRALKAWVIGATLGALACSEPIGPPRPTAVLDGRPEVAMHFLRWPDHGSAPRFVVVPRLPGRVLASAQAEPTPLERYQASIWARRGRAEQLRIDYAGSGGNAPFLQVTVPADALLRLPDGSAVAEGDSVLITLTIDSSLVRVKFGPSGLQFNPTSPLALDVYYGGAEQDLDGDGDVDADDELLREQRLGVWYQELTGIPWVRVPAAHDATLKRFSVAVFHFSGFAVSW